MKILKIVFVASTLGLQSATAAINWQTPITISGDSDVVTTGSLVNAWSLTDSFVHSSGDLIATVNGVSFIAIEPNWAYDGLVTFGLDGGDDVYGSVFDPFASLSSSYQTLLQFANWDDDNSTTPTSLTFTGLTPSTTYLVQLWASDSRPGSFRQQILTSPDGENSDLMTFRAGADGALGQYIVGSFTTGENVTTQSVTFVSSSLQVNAVQLRQIPEPATTVLATGLFALGLLAWRRLRN